MKSKKVGIKQFQANLTASFPEIDEVTTITRRNVPAYSVIKIPNENVSLKEDGQNPICSACGQEIINEK